MYEYTLYNETEYMYSRDILSILQNILIPERTMIYFEPR